MSEGEEYGTRVPVGSVGETTIRADKECRGISAKASKGAEERKRSSQKRPNKNTVSPCSVPGHQAGCYMYHVARSRRLKYAAVASSSRSQKKNPCGTGAVLNASPALELRLEFGHHPRVLVLQRVTASSLPFR